MPAMARRRALTEAQLENLLALQLPKPISSAIGRWQALTLP
jgi:hypothetical protein